MGYHSALICKQIERVIKIYSSHPHNQGGQCHDKGFLLGLISLLLETNTSPRLNRSGALSPTGNCRHHECVFFLLGLELLDW